MRKKISKRRRNPSELSDLNELKIRADLKVVTQPLSARTSRVIIYYKGTPIVDKEVNKADAEILASKHGKEKLARKFAPILNQPRKNPKQPAQPKEEKTPSMPIGGIKLDPPAAYRLGYRKGLLDGLNKCGIGDFFERQTLRKQLSKALDESLDEFHERITSAAQIGRFPQIK